MPARPPLAQVVATRTGLGGVVGQKRTYFSWRFVVDFAGGDLSMFGKDVKVERDDQRIAWPDGNHVRATAGGRLRLSRHV